jgi:hypothetical protein
MNRNFNPISAALRTIFAAGSVVVTIAIVGAVGALARHYEAEAQLAQTQPMTLAQL